MSAIIRQLSIFLLFAIVAIVFFFCLVSLHIEVYWIGLLEQGARIFNHRSLSLIVTTVWPTVGSREVVAAPLAALISYLLSEWARRFLDVEPGQSLAILMALVFSLGVITYLRNVVLQRNTTALIVLGGVTYAAIALPVLALDTLVYLFALLPAVYGTLKRPSSNSLWQILLLIFASRLLGIDGEQVIMLVAVVLISQIGAVNPREFKILSLVILTGSIELWWLGSVLSADPFPYFSNLSTHSSGLYATVRGFHSVDFHGRSLLAFVVASSPLLAVALHRVRATELARMLFLVTIALLLCERAIPVFALVYSVCLVELISRHWPNSFSGLVRYRIISELVATLLMFFCLGIQMLLSVGKTDIRGNRAVDGLVSESIPQQQGRVFSDWRLGDYLRLKGALPFADSRIESLPRNLQRAYVSLMRGEIESPKYLEEWNVTQVITAGNSPLCYLLQAGGGWSVSGSTLSNDPRERTWISCERKAT